MIIRIVKLKFQKDKVADFLNLFDNVVTKVNAYPGCQQMHMVRDLNDETLFFTYSVWENTTALEKDILDFSVDIIVTLPEQQSVNFVSINPVIFSKSAYVSIVDISTSKEEEGVFVTVPGWESLKFAKTITPEANEYLTDSQVAATLAPSRFNYTSQGIYPFPTTIAKKIKITLLMDKPSSQIYERTYILMRNTVEIENTVTTTRTSRKLGL
jgi:hypothetical protein